MNNNQKATKHALLTSVMALVMCVVMLVGTTFAWFTDTASTAVNKIQAGNLDIEVKYTLDGDNWNDLDGAADIFQKGLWEPGHTEVVALKFKNNGNLALKYSINMNIVDETVGINKSGQEYKLSDYLKVKTLSQEASGIGDICIGMAFSARNDGLGYTNTANFKDATVLDHDLFLAPGEVGNYLIMKVYMPETVGNEANAISTEKAASINFGLNVVATQVPYEKDSFGNTYDKDATYPAANADELKSALATGGIVSVNKDIKTDNIGDTVADRVSIRKPTTLNLDAKIISPDNMGNNGTNFCALIVDADTTINAGESGGIDTGTNGGYGINVRNGATLTINGGSYYGGGTAVQVQEGTLIINGGTFACEPFGDPYGYNFLINCIDSAYKNGTAKVEIKGGTFVNFDPSNCQAEGAGTNFVADGYKVVSATQTNGDTWYTVVSK